MHKCRRAPLGGLCAYFSMTKIAADKKQNILLGIVWLLALALSVLWRLPHFSAFGLNNDEGAYLMWARLVADGYSLYSQTHSVSAPLFIEGLVAAFKLFGFSVVLGRWLILLTFALLAATMSGIGYRVARWWGAFAALAMVAIPTPFFQLSRQVMAEIPATLFAVLAVAVAWGYSETKNRGWLAASGALLAISLLTKTLYPAALLPVGWFIWRSEPEWRGKLWASLAFGIPLAVSLLVIISFFDVPAFFNQAIRFRGDLRTVSPWDWRQNWQTLVQFQRPLWGIWLLAGAGSIIAARKIRAQAWFFWLLGNIALLLWHNPLFPHHLLILLAPAILLALELAAFICENLRIGQKKALWGVSIFAVAAFSIPHLVQLNQGWLRITTGGREADAAFVLKTVTRPDDFVVSDSQLLALWANRRTPPPMGDIALVAIKAGWQTSDRLMVMSDEYRVQAVANWALRLPWLPEYLNWAEQNFLVHKVWDNDHQLYFGRKVPPGEPVPHEQTVRLGGVIQLRGYSIDAADIRAGNDLPLTIYWQAEKPIPTDYTIFVQVLDSQGQLAAQNDSQPLYGYFPTSHWQPGEIVPDRVDISLPAELPAGNYTIIAGMYNLQTLERVPVAETGSDFVMLTPLLIESK